MVAVLSSVLLAITSVKSHYRNFEPPFAIPDSWEWVRLEEIAYVASGSTPSKESFTDSGIPYLKMYNLRNQKIDFDYHPQYISEEIHNGKLARSRAQSGDLIMNIVGPPLGKLAIIPESIQHCNFNQAAVMIRPYLEVAILNQYLFFYLSEMSEINSIVTKGTAGQTNISLSQSQNMRIPVPPLGEMERINYKTSILISLIEDIENYTCGLHNSIKAVKNKILELAMQGKLVPQDTTDEPAADMLRRINPKAKIITDNPHYPQLPSGWCIAAIHDVFEINPKNIADGNTEAGFVPMASICDGFNNSFIHSTRKWDEIKNGFTHFANGDIAVAKISPCLENRKSMILKNLPNGIGSGTTELLVFRSKMIYPEYGLLFFKSDNFIKQCIGTFNGVVGQQRVGKNNVEEIPFPIPPYNAQIQIANVVKRLFESLDQVNSNLAN